jgi:hypothetical protein
MCSSIVRKVAGARKKPRPAGWRVPGTLGFGLPQNFGQGGLDWTALHCTGLDWTGLDWTGLDWTGLDWTEHGPGNSNAIG